MNKVFVYSSDSGRIKENLKDIMTFTDDFDEADVIIVNFPNVPINRTLLTKGGTPIYATGACCTTIRSQSDLNKTTFEGSLVSLFIRAKKQDKKIILLGEFACAVMASCFNLPLVSFNDYSDVQVKHSLYSELTTKNISDVHEVKMKIPVLIKKEWVNQSYFIKSDHTFTFEIPSTIKDIKVLSYSNLGKAYLIKSLNEEKYSYSPMEEAASFVDLKNKTLFIVDDCLNITASNEEYLLQLGIDYLLDLFEKFEDLTK